MKQHNYFNVLGKYVVPLSLDNLEKTPHFEGERLERHLKILEVLGKPNQAWSFLVDKAHPNGNEIHTVFNNGVIVITNQRTGKLITELIARPMQIRRYWEGLNLEIPEEVLKVIAKARNHKEQNFNNW